MIEKRTTCLYCGKEMESKTAKKKFCSDLHRVYYAREKERGTLVEAKIEMAKAEIKKVIEVISPKTEPLLSEEEKSDILRQIKEWENKKCPSYVHPLKFKQQVNLEIQNLKSKLQ